MSHKQRFVVGTVLTMTLFGLWYQSNYVVPLAPHAVPLPYPNGYDTLRQAEKLRTVRSVTPLEYRESPLSERCQKLLMDNQESLEMLRVGLEQDYRIPESEKRTFEETGLHGFVEQTKLLVLAANTYAEIGNLSAAMRCAIDSIALGIQMPCGGTLTSLMVGNYCERMGHQSAWKLAERIDGKTAREAVRRLEKLEARRYSAVESVREQVRCDLNDLFHSRQYRRGPVAAGSGLDFRPFPWANADLWSQMKAAYSGPKAFMASSGDYVNALEKQTRLPWNPQQFLSPQPQMLKPALFRGINEYEHEYSDIEFQERGYKMFSALLQAYLALRAYKLERGSYPDSLENLVAQGYLASVPRDPFSPTHAPLHYWKKVNGAMTLWSVGPDAKDDGGQPIKPFGMQPLWLIEKAKGFAQGDGVANRIAFPEDWAI